MHGVLGGFKNMLRTWRNNLRKKKQKKLQEEQKITKFPRLQSFLYSTLAIIYWPIGTVLFSKEKTITIKSEQPKIYNQMQNLDLKLDKILLKQISKPVKKDMIRVEKEIARIKQEINRPMSKDSHQYFEEKTQELEAKIKYLKLPTTQKKEIAVVSKNINKKQRIKKQSIKTSNSPLKLQPTPIFIPIINSESVKEIQKDNRLEYIKKANKEVKEIEEKAKKITSKIDSITTYNSLYTLESRLKELTKKLELLKQQYQDFKINEVEDTFTFDKIELSKSPKKIEQLIEKVTVSLKKIDSKKDELFYKKAELVKEEKVKQKEVKEKKQEKKEVKEVNETLYAQELLLQNIMNQNKLLEQYMKKLKYSKNKKKTLFSSLISFSKNIVNFSLSLYPFSFFKNRIVGTFLSTVMINNSIKTMRKMTNPELEIKYEIFDKAYFEGKNLIESSYYMCENSLSELSQLKDELLLLRANKEAIILLKQLEQLENNIEQQKQSLHYKKSKLDKVYIKVKKAG